MPNEPKHDYAEALKRGLYGKIEHVEHAGVSLLSIGWFDDLRSQLYREASEEKDV